MADVITYQAPIGGFVRVGSTKFKVDDFHIAVSGHLLEVTFLGDQGDKLYASWEGAAADAYIAEINRHDFSGVHLQKYLIQIALADGKILPGGSVS